MDTPFYLVPKLIVHPDRVITCSECVWLRPRPKYDRRANLDSKRSEQSPTISVNARRKIGKALDYLLFLANDKCLPDTAHGRSYHFKIAFITLTLPSQQIHSDLCIKNSCLNQLLIELRRYHSVKNYIWRAERQKNGNIHFHILIDRFVPWSDLRDRWNRIVNKLGYVDRYRDSMKEFYREGFKVRKELLSKWPYMAQLRSWQNSSKNNYSSPNSTDIHSLKKVRNAKKYIMKYVSKQEANEVIKGMIWQCNSELSNITGGVAIIDNQIHKELQHALSSKEVDSYHGDYFSVYYLNIHDLYNLGCYTIVKYFADFLSSHFNKDLQTLLQPVPV